MRADKYHPRYINRPSPRNLYTDFWDWLRCHPAWIFALILAYPYYIESTEEV